VFPIARALKLAGAYVIGVIGFRTRELVFWEERFRAACDELVLCSDDGSVGMKGLVTEGIARVIAEHADIDELVAIGPPVMMRACAELTKRHGIPTVVSLNPIMVDGTGMCGGCRVKIGGQVKFACVDGPDFDGHQVDFDDLMSRLRRFREEEKVALERWSASCRMKDQISPGPPESLPPAQAAPGLSTAQVPPDLASEPLVLPDPFEEVEGG